MKTFLKLKVVDDVSEKRALASLFISLIAIVLLSIVTMTIVDKEISFYKAGKIFIKNIREFIEYINNKKQCAFLWFRELLCKFALKESRAHRPSTKVSLEWRPVYA